jgi:hypothetical protein
MTHMTLMTQEPGHRPDLLGATRFEALDGVPQAMRDQNRANEATLVLVALGFSSGMNLASADVPDVKVPTNVQCRAKRVTKWGKSLLALKRRTSGRDVREPGSRLKTSHLSRGFFRNEATRQNGRLGSRADWCGRSTGKTARTNPPQARTIPRTRPKSNVLSTQLRGHIGRA